MVKLILPFIIILISIGCCPEPKLMSPDEIAKEESAIKAVCESYNKASEEKNWQALVETLASEVIFFGTDSSEIIKNFADFKVAMQKQWQLYDKTKYGSLDDVSIQMDNTASWASIIYGVSVYITMNNITKPFFLRVARTMKKEHEKWVILSGIVGVTSGIDMNNHSEVPVQDSTLIKK